MNAVAQKCDITESLLRKYFKGTVPGLDKAVRIAEATQVDLRWLATGDGPMRPWADGGVNGQLLSGILKAVEEHLDNEGLILEPQKKADLIAVLYDHFVAVGEIEGATVRRYLQLVQ